MSDDDDCDRYSYFDCFRMFHGGSAEHLGTVLAESQRDAERIAGLFYGHVTSGRLYVELSPEQRAVIGRDKPANPRMAAN
jgi:hypothetical protein